MAAESHWPGIMGISFKVLCSVHTFVPGSLGTQLLHDTCSKDKTSFHTWTARTRYGIADIHLRQVRMTASPPSILNFCSHSKNLGLMGSVGPKLLPCSWDLMYSALLCLLSSHSEYRISSLFSCHYLWFVILPFSLSPHFSPPALSWLFLLQYSYLFFGLYPLY